MHGWSPHRNLKFLFMLQMLLGFEALERHQNLLKQQQQQQQQQ